MYKSLIIENNPRVQAIEINNNVVLFNCYFPCDSRNNNYGDWKLHKCLRDINLMLILAILILF